MARISAYDDDNFQSDVLGPDVEVPPPVSESPEAGGSMWKGVVGRVIVGDCCSGVPKTGDFALFFSLILHLTKLRLKRNGQTHVFGD